MNRRAILSGAGAAALAAIITPERALAAAQLGKGAAAGVDWRVGFQGLEADLAPARMRRVSGRAPAGLRGSLYRNGPGLFRRPGGSVDHWFDGDGLMRSFRIEDGEVTLTARFVDTEKRRLETAAGAVVTPGFGTRARKGAAVTSNDAVNPANISVIPMAGAIWALWEGGSPVAMDPRTLQTRGLQTLRPDLAHMPFLAHPRLDPGGDLWNLGVSGSRAMVWRLGADGGVKSAEVVRLPAASYIHDFVTTQRHLVIVLQPWIQDRMTLPYVDSLSWRPEQGTKILVLDKADLTRRRIYELPAFFAFHYGGAWEEPAGTIRFDACAVPDPSFATTNGRTLMQGTWTDQPAPKLTLITLPAGGSAKMEATASPAEFPRADPRFEGLPRRYTIHATDDRRSQPMFGGLAVRDWKTGRSDAFDFGPSHLVEEAVFAARPGGSAELDGWLLAPTVNLAARATELHVFDAMRVSAGPLATWRAEHALPVSLHGTFVA